MVCDDLVQQGGHEKVILDVCRIFPEASLYTTLATKKWQEICNKEGIELKTSFLQKLPFKRKLNRVYAPLLLYILALENFNFDEYDLVISLSSRFAHGIVTKPQTKHVCYMSTVGRMFWEPDVYFEHEKFALSGLLQLPLSYIRLWDRIASQRANYFIANSEITRKRIRKYYGRDAVVINPAIEIKEFSISDKQVDEDFYLILTRLVSWKKVDIAIRACKELGLRLKIIGTGLDKARLEKITQGNKNIEFLGFISDERKVEYLQNCRALINTQFEDFGIVPLEAMACGKPVIAYKKGGVLETIKEGKTGEFFLEQTAESLSSILKDFTYQKYNKENCRKQAEKFTIKKFNERISSLVYTN